MIRFACSGALACAAVALASSPASAAAGPVITSGTLTDASGTPTAGKVRVYPFPHVTERTTLPVLGEAHAGSDGRFTVRASDARLLERYARQRDGYLSFTAVADTLRYRGEWTFTAFIGEVAGEVRVVDSDAVTRSAGVARIAAADAPGPRISIPARVPRPLFAHTSQQCKNERQVQPVRRTRAATVVGELNNAYNDGTWARFSYGRTNFADSHIGVVWDSAYANVGPIISGEEHITDEGVARFPPVRHRWARRLKSNFQYRRDAVRNNTCAVWDVYVRAEEWVDGTHSRTKQRGTLNKCDAVAYLGFEGGADYVRRSREAVRWKRGAAAFGFYLTVQSGFSESVMLEYRFGGPLRKRHYLCGPDGRQSPYHSGRVFSGRKR